MDKCSIVRDLLPSYIDKLTSEESNQMINSHIKECESCQKVLKKMTNEMNISLFRAPAEKMENNLIKRRIQKKLFPIVSMVIITFLAIGFFLGAFLFQEGNPIQLIKGIIKLETSDNEYILFSEQPTKYLSKANIDRKKLIVEYMENRGWKYIEQMGNSFIFTKETKTVYVENRQFTKRYFVWQIPSVVTLE